MRLSADQIRTIGQTVTEIAGGDASVRLFGSRVDNAARGGDIAVIDNLKRAERWGWLISTDDWLRLRQLRNRMIHEYVKDPAVLSDALNSGHAAVPMLLAVAKALCAEVDARLAP